MPDVPHAAPFTRPVSDIFMQHLPRAAQHSEGDLHHMAISAYELAGEALVAFGVAKTISSQCTQTRPCACADAVSAMG